MGLAFSFQQMNQQEAEEIANNWKYNGIYSFYDASADEEDYLEFLDPSKRGNNYFSCYVQKSLVAFYSVEVREGNIAELGLGMKPEYTGKGLGLSYINAILAHVTSLYSINDFALSVATFNQRAINVYRAAGFSDVGVFTQSTNGSEFEFLKMEKTNA